MKKEEKKKVNLNINLLWGSEFNLELIDNHSISIFIQAVNIFHLSTEGMIHFASIYLYSSFCSISSSSNSSHCSYSYIQFLFLHLVPIPLSCSYFSIVFLFLYLVPIPLSSSYSSLQFLFLYLIPIHLSCSYSSIQFLFLHLVPMPPSSSYSSIQFLFLHLVPIPPTCSYSSILFLSFILFLFLILDSFSPFPHKFCHNFYRKEKHRLVYRGLREEYDSLPWFKRRI